MIMIDPLRLGYQNVPKIATTSIFHWLYQAINGQMPPGPDGRVPRRPNERRSYFRNGCNGSTWVENAPDGVQPYGSYFRFAFTRDPIKRFLSMYSNRVIHHRGLSRRAKWAPKLIKADLPFDPEINELVARLNAYLRAAKVIYHHSRPMMDFLGPDLAVYDRLADISEVATVMNEIKTFWKREGMRAPLERSPAKVARLQAEGPKLGLEVLTPASFERLLEYYREDYARIPLVSLEAIKNEYSSARANAPVSMPAAISPLPGPAPGATAGAGAPGAFVARKTHCPLVQALRVSLPRTRSALAASVAMKGVVVLKAGVPPDEWKLTVSDGTAEHGCRWGLPSPQAAAKFPGNPRAANARFSAPEVTFVDPGPVSLYLRNTRGQRHLLLEVRIGDPS